jgi:hypothetical protein
MLQNYKIRERFLVNDTINLLNLLFQIDRFRERFLMKRAIDLLIYMFQTK